MTKISPDKVSPDKVRVFIHLQVHVPDYRVVGYIQSQIREYIVRERERERDGEGERERERERERKRETPQRPQRHFQCIGTIIVIYSRTRLFL